MSANKRGLGKGLDALLSSTVSVAQKEAAAMTGKLEHGEGHKLAMFSGKTIISLNIADIVPNPRQPRHAFPESSLKELAESIREHGVAQPLLVRKKGDKYELVAGERRLRASNLAGLIKVPAVIREMSDEESLEIAIIENIQREDLNPLDEAESYQLLIKEFNLTQEEIAKKVSKARSSVANTLRLLELPKEIKESLRSGEITAGHARAILAAGNYIAQLRLWDKIKKENLNVRDAERSSIKKVNKNLTKENRNLSESLSDIEHSLSSKFSTKVEINGSEQKGLIQIKYFSRDDLERITALLLKNQVI